MKPCKNLLFLLLVIGITGCQPKVITNVIKTYPITVPADSVKIYELADTVPNGAEAIGNVKVLSRGPSNKFKYSRALVIGREETSRRGGNAFAVMEQEPFGPVTEDCREMMGLILYVSDFSTYADRPNPYTEIREPVKVLSKKGKSFPKNTLSMDIGYGIITSKIYTPYTTYEGKGCLEWKIQYERLLGEGIGISFQYAGSKTSFPENEKLLMTYIAPGCIYKGKIQQWRLKVGIGLGYFSYKDKYGHTSETGIGLGFNTDLGVEYVLSKHIGLGFSINLIEGFLPENEKSMDVEPYEVSGIARINFLGGIRFYF